MLYCYCSLLDDPTFTDLVLGSTLLMVEVPEDGWSTPNHRWHSLFLAALVNAIICQELSAFISGRDSDRLSLSVIRMVSVQWRWNTFRREAEGTDSQIKPDNDFHTRILLSSLSWSNIWVIKEVNGRWKQKVNTATIGCWNLFIFLWSGG